MSLQAVDARIIGYARSTVKKLGLELTSERRRLASAFNDAMIGAAIGCSLGWWLEGQKVSALLFLMGASYVWYATATRLTVATEAAISGGVAGMALRLSSIVLVFNGVLSILAALTDAKATGTNAVISVMMTMVGLFMAAALNLSAAIPEK